MPQIEETQGYINQEGIDQKNQEDIEMLMEEEARNQRREQEGQANLLFKEPTTSSNKNNISVFGKRRKENINVQGGVGYQRWREVEAQKATPFSEDISE